MKIAYIVNRVDGPGGLERVLSIKASMLAEKYNHEVHFITLNQQEDTNFFYEFSSKIKYHNISAPNNPLLRIRKYVQGIKKWVSELQPDVIAVCDDGLKGFFVPFILDKKYPIIYERHVSKNVEKQGKRSLIKKIKTSITFKLMEIGGKEFDKFIVLTKGNLEEWKLNNLKVIPNPLSFYPETPSTLQNKKVIAVGKQCFQKGYDRLLPAWKNVVSKHPDWKLEIYGTIDEKQGLSKLASDLNIEDNVFFYPPIKNIGDKYQQASIYTMSSRYEGFGMVLTEAMAYGVPCISFDCPYGPSDIISDGEDGFIISNGNIEELSHKINHLIEHSDKRIEMGSKARVAVQRYLPEKILEEWNTLFTNLAN